MFYTKIISQIYEPHPKQLAKHICNVILSHLHVTNPASKNVYSLAVFGAYLRDSVIAGETCRPWRETQAIDVVIRIPVEYASTRYTKHNYLLII